MSKPEISVILPVRNGAGSISHQLGALDDQRCRLDWEVIIVDNGSKDGTASIAEAWASDRSHARVVYACDRDGLSHARNVGVASAGADMVVFCDDDDEISPGWVEAMHAALREQPLVASVFEYERLNDERSNVARGSLQTTHVARWFGVGVAMGAGHGCQRWLFEAVGGNDESMDCAGEDIDFCLRAHRDYGVEASLASHAIYHYRRRQGAKASFLQAHRYGRSHVRLFERHGSPGGRSRIGIVLRDWLWLVTRGPSAVWSPARRDRWVWRLGIRSGRLRESLVARVLYL